MICVTQGKEYMVTITKGQAITSNWGQWYRHDKVVIDGKELEGSIQVRRRYYGKSMGHRIETITCYQNACVVGSDWVWLAWRNGYDIRNYELR